MRLPGLSENVDFIEILLNIMSYKRVCESCINSSIAKKGGIFHYLTGGKSCIKIRDRFLTEGEDSWNR